MSDVLTPEQVRALTPGNRVAWDNRGGGFGLGHVVRLTPKQIIVESDFRGQEIRIWRDGRNAGTVVGEPFARLVVLDCPSVRNWLARNVVQKFEDRAKKALTPPRKTIGDGKYSWTVGWQLDSAAEVVESLRSELANAAKRLESIADGTIPELRPRQTTMTPGSW